MTAGEIAAAWERLDAEEQAAVAAAVVAVRENFAVERAGLRSLLRQLDKFADEADAFPSDWVRQCQAVREFGVSRSFLYDLAVAQLKIKSGIAKRLPNGSFQYSLSLLTRYLALHPVRRCKR